MKKIILSLIVVLFSSLVYSQDNPNRLIIHNSVGDYKGYLAERIDSLTFVKVDGRVAADLEVLGVELDELKVKVTRTPACMAFKIGVLSKVMVDRLSSDVVMANYIEKYVESSLYYEDFKEGLLTGIELESNTEYALVTLGYDNYGIACSASRADFTTPKIPLVGNPVVEIELIDLQEREFTAKFTPNEDVLGYGLLAMKEGELESQFEMWGPMMGFKNISEMIRSFSGKDYHEEAEFTWTAMDPGTDYVIYAQAWDENETYTDPFELKIKTLSKGGPGAAVVDIELGEYKLMDWYGEMKPSQFITFTPNDQTNSYRVGVYFAEDFEEYADEIKDELASLPPFEMIGWFQYEALTTDFQIDPNTDAVAVAVARNSNGEWGEFTIVPFTTPSEVSDAPNYKANNSNKILERNKAVEQKPVFEKGKVPTVKKRNKIELK